MPNSYTSAPGIVPGNLTVNGDEIRIGKTSPFARLGKDPDGSAFTSINFDPATSTFDSVALSAVEHKYRTDALLESLQPLKSGGLGLTLTYDYTIGQQQARLTITGTTVEQSLFVFTLPAGIMGSESGFSYRLFFSTSAQGAVATVMRIKFAGLTLHSQSFASVPGETNWVGIIQSNSARTAVFSELFALSSAVGTLGPFEDTVAADLTALQTFQVTLQLGSTTDNWLFEGWRVDDFIPQAAFP